MRNTLIAKIHIAKNQLSLDDDVYRDVLNHVVGKTSCSKMSDAQLKKVLEHFKDKGFKAKPAKGNRRMSPSSSEPVKTPAIRKIRAIWITMAKQNIVRDSSELALNAYVKRMSAQQNNGKGVQAVSWLTADLAHKILEALKAWHTREMLKKLATVSITRNTDGIPLYKVTYSELTATFTQVQNQGQL